MRLSGFGWALSSEPQVSHRTRCLIVDRDEGGYSGAVDCLSTAESDGLANDGLFRKRQSVSNKNLGESMSERVVEADYLIIGAGASAMAFADELLSHSSSNLVIVDRRDSPGGHWNDAYPFVRLHQPSEFYGVNSRELGQQVKYVSGPNKGLYNLASGSEVLAYFDKIMQQRFLPSGRVQYFPMCNVISDSQFESIPTGDTYSFLAKKAIVDAAYSTFEIPSTHPPKYTVAPGIRLVSPNQLPKAAGPADKYVIVGAGKTAMDAGLWLLERGIDADRIRWIIPRDFWFLNRANIQPGEEFFLQSFGSVAQQFEALAAAESICDLFDRLEAAEQLLRLDSNFRPTAYRCAVVSKDELLQLRRIKNIVRMGHVQAIQQDRIILDSGQIALTGDDLIINCTASGISRKPLVPIWTSKRITLEHVRTCQPLFSAAFVGFIEATFGDDPPLKNSLSAPVPLPVVDTDWLTMLAVTTKNRVAWRGYPQIEKWLAQSRLNGFFALAAQVKHEDIDKMMILQRFQEAASAATSKLPMLLNEVN
jgi:hypothetical protein